MRSCGREVLPSAISLLLLLVVDSTCHATTNPSSSASSLLPPFPNIEYLGMGYDLLQGNPFQLRAIDPGFRYPFILLNYSEGITWDNKWAVPNNISISSALSCTIDCMSTVLNTAMDFQSKVFGETITFAADATPLPDSFFASAFTANAQYQSIYASLPTGTSLAYCSAYCNVYSATLGPLNAWGSQFSPTFLEDVANLGGSVSYAVFTQYYGTHFTTQIEMGGRSTYARYLSGNNVSNLVNANVNLFTLNGAITSDYMTQLGANVSGKVYSDMEAYINVTTSAINWGGFPLPKPPAINSSGYPDAWQDAVLANPYPVTYTLAPFADLLSPHFFPNDPAILQKKLGLISYIASTYCSTLLNCGVSFPPNVTGMMAFFNTSTCPTGWEPADDAAGRIIFPRQAVSPDCCGPSPDAPFLDGQDLSHSHPFAALSNFQETSAQAIPGSSSWFVLDGASAAINTLTNNATYGLSLVQLLLCKTHPQAASSPALMVPSGSVTYFDSSQTFICPASWATIPAVMDGRTLVPQLATQVPVGWAPVVSTMPGLSPNQTLGTHTHDIMVEFEATYTMNLAVASGGNAPVTVSQVSSVGTESKVDNANIPTYTTLGCASINYNPTHQTTGSVPYGMLLFSLTNACPVGWVAAGINPLAAGRFIVAVGTGGTNNVVFGSGTALGPNATVIASGHTHTISDQPVDATTYAGAQGWWIHKNDWVQNPVLVHSVAQNTTIQIPFMQLLLCQQA